MKDGKTIKQIADELGVSKQAVHQKRKNKEYEERLRKFTSTIDGVVYISIDGQKILKEAFNSVKDSKCVDVNESSIDNNSVYDILKVTIEVLQQQLSVKDKQIDELNARLAEAHRMADQAQKLHGADKVLELNDPKIIEESKKKSFWDRFKRNTDENT